MNNAPSKFVLSCHKLSKIFTEAESVVHVLNKVQFSVSAGEMIAIVGVSGSGKSTLLHLLGGLDQPTEGNVLVQGVNLTSLSENDKGKIRNQKLGFVYQFHHLLPEFSALENVCMPLLIRGMPAKLAVEKAEEMINRVDLHHRRTHRIGELSGGERQRIAIARALVTHPLCVLADEPTGNLDHRTATHIFDLMLKLNQEYQTSFVVVTHNDELAKQMDKIYVLENGTLKLTEKTAA
jgi:lipoprotein-releasing system ATP-binding protein